VNYKEMQDIEFTFERGKLYMLQCRTGKRTPAAVFRIAVEQASRPLLDKAEAARIAKKGFLPKKYVAAAAKPVITKDEAIQRITQNDLERLFYPVISPHISSEDRDRHKIAEGINAVPGAACGKVAFNAADAEALAAQDEPVILVRKETSPEDVGGMQAAKGILTQTGGKTSHAAVVARGWGKCCIVGCGALEIDYNQKQLRVNGTVVREHEYLTLDGSTGTVYSGKLELQRPEPPEEYYTLMTWADERRRLLVRTNADTPEDSARAVEFGAQGIGLCRTEHMFFATRERQLAIQEMIVAEREEDRRAALEKLLPYQRHDFIGIFEAMDGRPVTVRLLDPPLHEFVPKTHEEAQSCRVSRASRSRRSCVAAEALHESNPMLGTAAAGCASRTPRFSRCRSRAIIEAAVEVKKPRWPVHPGDHDSADDRCVGTPDSGRVARRRPSDHQARPAWRCRTWSARWSRRRGRR
jgi:pyruvate,orthophosphate dikinase